MRNWREMDRAEIEAIASGRITRNYVADAPNSIQVTPEAILGPYDSL